MKTRNEIMRIAIEAYSNGLTKQGIYEKIRAEYVYPANSQIVRLAKDAIDMYTSLISAVDQAGGSGFQ